MLVIHGIEVVRGKSASCLPHLLAHPVPEEQPEPDLRPCASLTTIPHILGFQPVLSLLYFEQQQER